MGQYETRAQPVPVQQLSLVHGSLALTWFQHGLHALPPAQHQAIPASSSQAQVAGAHLHRLAPL